MWDSTAMTIAKDQKGKGRKQTRETGGHRLRRISGGVQGSDEERNLESLSLL